MFITIRTIIAIIIVKIIAIVTYLFLLKASLRPPDGMSAFGAFLNNECVSDKVGFIAFGLLSMIFVRYSPIQFVIMQAMTSFTLNSALNNPESAPQSAPINAATIMHAYQGSCHTSAA